MDLLPVHVDDAFYRAHQESLHLGVVFRDDDEAVLQVIQASAPGRHGQVENRNGTPTDIGDPAHHRTGLGHKGEAGALQHLLHLEHVDPVELRSVETEQQQLQAVLPDQLGTLVNRIQNTGHDQTPITSH
ncbi:hypothetical protein D3C77_626630 [compost metagenome]